MRNRANHDLQTSKKKKNKLDINILHYWLSKKCNRFRTINDYSGALTVGWELWVPLRGYCRSFWSSYAGCSGWGTPSGTESVFWHLLASCPTVTPCSWAERQENHAGSSAPTAPKHLNAENVTRLRKYLHFSHGEILSSSSRVPFFPSREQSASAGCRKLCRRTWSVWDMSQKASK